MCSNYNSRDLCVLAGDVRNDLYVTLQRGEFEKGNKTAGKNIEVKVTVLDKCGNIIKV